MSESLIGTEDISKTFGPEYAAATAPEVAVTI
jgi:hypothetical protein